ncbi:acyltransferase [Arthrobacter sp. V1I9]|uniref:acyltransferase n=1 Tax=Arthrobacter sp. V1I9 TaxID=3042275 RepID=UPI0027D8BC12|nr:acyltransferase [Arthrobacter sp. V1I9]
MSFTRKALNAVKYRQNLLRGYRLSLWIKAWGGTCGPRLAVEPGVRLMRPPSKGWYFGSDVYLGHGVVLDVGEKAELVFGDRVKVFHHSLIGAFDSVRIGDNVQVAESVTIRDHNHDTAAVDMHKSMSKAAVSIGNDAWIARGVAVLAGVTVGSGAVVAANAVVTKDVPTMAVAAGVPAKVISHREQLSA